MSIPFTKLEGPFGVPVFHQQLPDIVKSTSMILSLFTGSVDDDSAGKPGLYHWFEHVPFRGTKKHPGGYEATKTAISKTGGISGASTGPFATSFHATVPTRFVEMAMDITVDLAAQPLLREQDIVAEREVIKQEIRDKLGSVDGRVSYDLFSLLWRDHPIGHHTLGTTDSLESMTPAILSDAHSQGYDRSRTALFVSTSLPADEILSIFAKRADTLPSNGLTERRRLASYGSLVWQGGRRIVIDTDFSSSVVRLLFPETTPFNLRDATKAGLRATLFQYGNTGSILSKAVRGDRQLAYSPYVSRFMCRDGGYWGFHVETSRENIGAVESALKGLFSDPRLHSREFISDYMGSIENSKDMEVINPRNLASRAMMQVLSHGDTYTAEDEIALLRDFSQDEILESARNAPLDEAVVIVFRGKED